MVKRLKEEDFKSELLPSPEQDPDQERIDTILLTWKSLIHFEDDHGMPREDEIQERYEEMSARANNIEDIRKIVAGREVEELFSEADTRTDAVQQFLLEENEKRFETRLELLYELIELHRTDLVFDLVETVEEEEQKDLLQGVFRALLRAHAYEDVRGLLTNKVRQFDSIGINYLALFDATNDLADLRSARAIAEASFSDIHLPEGLLQRMRCVLLACQIYLRSHEPSDIEMARQCLLAEKNPGMRVSFRDSIARVTGKTEDYLHSLPDLQRIPDDQQSLVVEQYLSGIVEAVTMGPDIHMMGDIRIRGISLDQLQTLVDALYQTDPRWTRGLRELLRREVSKTDKAE
jgi:hypothetical protein